MKRASFLLSFSLLAFYGCRHEPEKFGYINAGDNISEGIQYFDIPDTSLDLSGKFELDLDRDGIKDIGFNAWGGYVTPHTFEEGGEVSTFNKTYVCVDNYPLRLFTRAKICDSMKWESGPDQTLAFIHAEQIPGQGGIYQKGNWDSAKDNYLGFSIKNTDHTFYGWIRMDANMGHVTVKDYAFRE
jgi:hypothetical protein